nr:MAG TPA: hypothetical protein [Caudoviricetes sp.]
MYLPIYQSIFSVFHNITEEFEKITDFNKYLDAFSLNFPHKKSPLFWGLNFIFYYVKMIM